MLTAEAAEDVEAEFSALDDVLDEAEETEAAATGNGAEKVGMGFGLIGAAFLAVAVL